MLRMTPTATIWTTVEMEMTDAVGSDGVPAYTRRHWAKSDRGEPGRIHLLEHHLADVGAYFEAVLQ